MNLKRFAPNLPLPIVLVVSVLGVIGSVLALTAFPNGSIVTFAIGGLMAITSVVVLILDNLSRISNAEDERKLGRAFFAMSTWHFNSKLEALEKNLSDADLRTRGRTVKNLFQQPGIIAMHKTSLSLYPVFGKPTKFPLENIRSTKVSGAFNGSFTPGQTSFWLNVPGYWRIGFAIYDDPSPWREALPIANEPAPKTATGPSRS